MFLKFTITLLACSWGFAHAQDVSAPAGDPDLSLIHISEPTRP